jgi:hypothetical protein
VVRRPGEARPRLICLQVPSMMWHRRRRSLAPRVLPRLLRHPPPFALRPALPLRVGRRAVADLLVVAVALVPARVGPAAARVAPLAVAAARPST